MCRRKSLIVQIVEIKKIFLFLSFDCMPLNACTYESHRIIQNVVSFRQNANGRKGRNGKRSLR